MNQDSVNFGIVVEGIDLAKEIRERCGIGQNESRTRNADLFCTAFFTGYVGAGGGVLPDANKDQPRGDAPFRKGGDTKCSFAVNRAGKNFSIEDMCRHLKSLQ